jgi:hypothetical protein
VKPSTRIALGVIAVLAAVTAAFAASRVRDIGERASLFKSEDNMRSLATLLFDEAGPRLPMGGKRLALSLLLDGRIDRTNPRNLEVLFSPGDRELSFQKVGAAAYAGLTGASLLDPATDVRRLTSYAGRRRGAPSPTGRVPLFADLSFRDRGYVLVAWSDRRVEKLTRADLGLGPDDPIVVGPHSTSPILRELSDE